MPGQHLNYSARPVALIFAGGEGKRLWPISSAEEPKQLNPLFAKDTLVVEAYKRAKKFIPEEDIYVVTTKQLSQKVLSRLHIPSSQIIIQPENKDTTAAIAMCALVLSTKYSNAQAVVLYSDHLIVDIEKFVTSLKKAIALTANFDHIVTIGTRPTSPVSDFGYIEVGKKIADDHLFMINSFHEKPSRELAESFLKQGNYLWNTGVYVWSTNTLLKKIKEVQPQLYASLLELRIAINTPSFAATVEEWYQTIPPKAFEKSITEKLDDMCVYEADYEWLDVGNWKTVHTISKKNQQGNAVLQSPHSDVSFIDSTNCLVYGQSKRIGVIGLDNVIIVETDQELLICHQDKAAKVKDLVNGWSETE